MYRDVFVVGQVPCLTKVSLFVAVLLKRGSTVLCSVVAESSQYVVLNDNRN